MQRLSQFLCVVALVATFTAGAALAAPSGVQLETDGRTVYWYLDFEHGTADLTVTGPKKVIGTRLFEDGKRPYFEIFDDAGKELPDGRYNWQVTYVSPIDKELQADIATARIKDNEEFVCELVDSGVIESLTYSGTLQKIEGKWSLPKDVEEKSGRFDAVPSADAGRAAEKIAAADLADAPAARAANKDQVILDDLIVDGSACIGFDCVNGEAFSFDTIRLKENNLRIKFEDTSGGSFPTTDWELVANDSTNGGQSRFSIRDVSGNRTPFTVEANTPNHSLYVDDGGRVGLGTSTPTVELHVIDGDTPTLRLQQDGSSGFQPQTWDVAGNETSFFVRDASNGSTLPFRIRPSAPSQSLVIDSEGEIGIGVLDASARLHILGVDSGANALSMDFENSNTGTTWFFQNDQDNSFKISKAQSGGAEVTLRDRADGTGNATMVVDGSIQATNVMFASSRELKTAFAQVDPSEMLDRIAGLAIQEWRYLTEPETVKHVGPIAEEFAEAFGLGTSEKHITVTDVNGVALAAIQALHSELDNLRSQVEQLQEELAEARSEQID